MEHTTRSKVSNYAILYKHAAAVNNTDADAFVTVIADESSVIGDVVEVSVISDVVEVSVTDDVLEASVTGDVRPPISSGPLSLHKFAWQQYIP